MLPNEIDLAGELGVSIGTIWRAIDGLERSGTVVRRQGRGTFETGDGQDRGSPMGCPLQLAATDGGNLTCQTLSMRARRMTEAELRRFRMRYAGVVLQTCTLLRVSERNVGHERSLIPLARLPGPVAAGPSIADVRASLIEHGLAAKWCVDEIGIGTDASDMAKLPAPSIDLPLLECRRTSFHADHKPIEYRVIVFVCSDLKYVSRNG